MQRKTGSHLEEIQEDIFRPNVEQNNNIMLMLHWALDKGLSIVSGAMPGTYEIEECTTTLMPGGMARSFDRISIHWSYALLSIIPQTLGMNVLSVDCWNLDTIYEQVWDRFNKFTKAPEISKQRKVKDVNEAIL